MFKSVLQQSLARLSAFWLERLTSTSPLRARRTSLNLPLPSLTRFTFGDAVEVEDEDAEDEGVGEERGGEERTKV